MTSPLGFTRDDIFLLGNIAARAVTQGRGGEVGAVLQLLQWERPENAGGHMLQAVYLCSVGATTEAIEFLEAANVFDAETNGAETFAFFLILLKEQGDHRRLQSEIRKYRARHRVLPESARHAIETTLAEIQAQGRGTMLRAV
jgi:Flp pilus assembly protein TadD